MEKQTLYNPRSSRFFSLSRNDATVVLESNKRNTKQRFKTPIVKCESVLFHFVFHFPVCSFYVISVMAGAMEVLLLWENRGMENAWKSAQRCLVHVQRRAAKTITRSVIIRLSSMHLAGRRGLQQQTRKTIPVKSKDLYGDLVEGVLILLTSSMNK